ncbi:histidine kinase [Paenibacillus sp. HWE-109]|uniref:sensor histidine kinase n=1 Tax=Paenibacillus sp. HWE-109 TaxID=1306526 RepID=UPI001EDDF1DB|nr:ATP-binding protein [Paenibacillus sp. HWE-109]UKS26559.1 histidine kinase [Paenibacillus sp. HWE-109]
MKKKIFVGFCISVFCFLQIWCSSFIFYYPYLGIEIDSTQDKQWKINALTTEGAGIKLDLKLGDIVQQVDDRPAEESMLVKKWHTVEQADMLSISRNGIEYEISVNTKSNIFYDLLPLIEEIVCLFMAILLYIKMSYSKSAKLLAAVFISASFIFMGLGASIRGDAIGKLLITSFMMLMPIVFLHFLIVFFKEKGNLALPTWMLKYLYTIVVFTLCLRSLYFLPSLTYNLYHYDVSVTLGFFIFGFLINMYVLTVQYVKVRKQQSYMSSIIKSVWLSWLISFLPIICFSFLPQLLTGQRILNAIFTSWILLFFPISFAYLIASNQLYDFGQVIRRIMFAGLLAILPVSLFTGVYVFLFRKIADEKQILFIFVGSMIIVTMVLYAAEYWTTRLESFLFPRKYLLQTALKKIARNLGTISSFRELKEIILVDIVSTLQVMGGAIVFCYKNDTEIIYEGEIDISEVRQLVETSTLLDNPMYTCIEMNYHEAYTSYLIMTRKRTNTLLPKEEKQWLQLITSYLEVSLENVHLIRKLTVNLQQFASQLPHEAAAHDIQWFRKVMFELQEEERIRIATDLHDTTMQDLFFLKRRISTLAENSTMPKGDQEQLRNMNNFVDMINASLRQSCFELNPHLLKEVGLIKTLKMYVEKESYTAPFELIFEAMAVKFIEGKDLPTKRHIFRIVQELLNNAKKHSQATKVTFKIMESNQVFYLNYEDNGVGFSDKEGTQREIGASGMGIEQIRSRILHMGGQMDFLTQQGNGTIFKIRIPIEEVISA